MCINRRNSGLTLIEVMATVAIISILAAGILPLSQMMYKRIKELELRNNLRIIRTALDKYEELVDQGVVPSNTNSGYPESRFRGSRHAPIQGPQPSTRRGRI